LKYGGSWILKRSGCGGDDVAKESDGVDWSAGTSETNDGRRSVDIPDDNGTIGCATEEKAVLECERENGGVGVRREIEALKGGEPQSDNNVLLSPKHAMIGDSGRRGCRIGDQRSHRTAKSLMNKVELTAWPCASGVVNAPTQHVAVVASREQVLAGQRQRAHGVAMARAQLCAALAVDKCTHHTIGVSEPQHGVRRIRHATERHGGGVATNTGESAAVARGHVERIEAGVDCVATLAVNRQQKGDRGGRHEDAHCGRLVLLRAHVDGAQAAVGAR
jgi:hypothetical protein